MTDDVRDAYNYWAVTYESDTNPTRDLDAALVREIDWSGLDVVEIGCGTGKNSAWIAPRCRSLTGLDLSPAMLEHARRTVPGAHFVEADLTQPWPLAEASADAVIADLVLEHIGDLRHFYAESYRVLRQGGHLRIAELHPYRQLLGGRAHFLRDGERIDVPAFVHSVAEFANGGIIAGFALSSLDEASGPADETPRLLILSFRKQPLQ